MNDAPTSSASASKRIRKMAREPKVPASADEILVAPIDEAGTPTPEESATPALKPPIKAQIILGLLRRDEGATLQQLVAATGWLPHTTRAALTGIKRKGHALTSDKIDGVRTYRVAAGAASA